jgi:DNA ligase-1
MTFARLAIYFQQIEATSSRLSITGLLAELFKEAGEGEIAQICYLLQGRVAPLYDPVEFGVADKFMIRAIARAYDAAESDVQSAFKETGDLGTTAQTFAAEVDGGTATRHHTKQQPLVSDDKRSHTKGKSLSVVAVYDRLRQVADASGPGSQETKVAVLTDLLAAAEPLSARYVARIPLGKLRLGFSDMTVLDGLSWMIDGDKSHRKALEAAFNVRPDLGFLARSVKTNGAAGISAVTATVGAPILAALCQRLPNASEMIEKMGMVDAEPKYDGVRTQIHFQRGTDGRSDRTVSFSRNLESTTDMYPELTHIGRHIRAKSVILDSEAVGFDEKTGTFIPFQETVTRKRKYGIDDASRDVPLKFFVFDILAKDGKDLMGIPLSERRKILETTVLPGGFLVLAPHIVTDSADDLRHYHEQQIAHGLEGIVVKKWDSPYEPGRRGYSWVKFKEEEGKTGKLSDTVDCVIMGFTKGEGKRSGFGIGAFLVGVRDSEGRFVTVTKIGTGVTDEQWRDLAERLGKLKSGDMPKQYADVEKILMPDFWIVPEVVVEIAADDITRSPIHRAGFALRFPRLVRIRDDKRAEQVTTTSEIETMYRQQSSIVNGRKR